LNARGIRGRSGNCQPRRDQSRFQLPQTILGFLRFQLRGAFGSRQPWIFDPRQHLTFKTCCPTTAMNSSIVPFTGAGTLTTFAG